MSHRQTPARVVAKAQWIGSYWLDHTKVVEEDFEWLAETEQLTLWNVQLPARFLSRLDRLWWLDIRGGSANDLIVLEGCTRLQYLAVNQIRGLHDLSAISELFTVRYISLYGLKQVRNLPSCGKLLLLEHVDLGQMRSLESPLGVLHAPKLQDLELIRKININADDIQAIMKHPSIRRFGWIAEDVPDSIWVPVLKQIGLPTVPIESAADWFSHRMK